MSWHHLDRVLGRTGAMMNDGYDLSRLGGLAMVGEVVYEQQVDSTNRLACGLATQRPPQGTLLVLAESQTAGRGRGSHPWWTAPGSVAMSWLIDPTRWHIAPRQTPLISLLAALAVADAIEARTGLQPRLKWPNDVLIANRKVSGILVEPCGARPGLLIVGVGLNVHNSMQAAPPPLCDTATALCDQSPVELDRTELVAAVLERLDGMLADLGAGAFDLSELWSPRCALSGCEVTIEAAAEVFTGRCRGVEEDGALILETGGRVRRCLGGTVRAWSR